MIAKIKRQDCFEQYTIFPRRNYNYKTEEEDYFYPKVFNSYILFLPSKSFKGNARALGIELTQLARALNKNPLIFLGDVKSPWLRQVSDYKPAVEAQDYLIGNKIGKHFNGGLQVDLIELPTFIRHLAWLIRCNASLPYIHFTDEEQRIVGSICKYGNLHLSIINEQTDIALKQFIEKSNFKTSDDSRCDNRFSKSGRIPGRQIIV